MPVLCHYIRMVRRNWSVTIVQSHCSLFQPNTWRGLSMLLCTIILCPFSVIGNMDLQKGDPALPNSPLFTISGLKHWIRATRLILFSWILLKHFNRFLITSYYRSLATLVSANPPLAGMQIIFPIISSG